jgi:hypothetical protein
MLDSYPKIYVDERGNPLSKSVLVDTVLSTDTSIADDLKRLRIIAVPRISPVDRETLGNGIAEIEDAYREGWLSGSDEDDD